MNGRSAKEHASAGNPRDRSFGGAIRRFVVTATKGALWKILGTRGLDGGDETGAVEVFQGIGIAARPPVDGKPEAIVVSVDGKSKAAVIVATRDQRTLKAVLAELGELEAGSALVYSAGAVVYVRANGTVEIRSPNGSAAALATKADVDAFRAALNAHTHTYLAGAAGQTVPTLTTVNPSVPAPTGTTVLKAE